MVNFEADFHQQYRSYRRDCLLAKGGGGLIDRLALAFNATWKGKRGIVFGMT